MPAFGVYPVADVLSAGEEISSTYEGRHVTVLESDLIHPTHTDGYVEKGDPVVYGTTGLKGVGVSFKEGEATGDLIALDTEGVWNLDVVAANDAGNVAVAGGDIIYINTSTAVLSKIVDQATQIPFGIALGAISSGNTERIAVKVHAHPSLVNSKRTYFTVTDGQYVFGRHHTSVFAGGQSTGLEYFDQQVTGVMDGDLYGLGTWLELQSGFTANANLLVAHDIGIYDEGATLTSAAIIVQQMQAILASAPDTFHWWRLNYGVGGGTVTALIQAANPASLDYANLNTQSDPPIGYISFATIVGVNAGNPVQIRVYADRD